jgi:hypothetical protein
MIGQRNRPFPDRPAGGGLILALAVLASAIAPPATVAHAPDPLLGGGLYPQAAVLKWRWMPNQEPPAWMKPAIEAGAVDVTDSRVSKAPTFQRDANGKGDVQYGPGVPCGAAGIACARRMPPDDFLIAFREQGRAFDWGNLNWCQFHAVAPNGCYDVENITLDELGHVLVLDHHANFTDQRDYRDAVVQTVSRTKPKDGWNAHLFGRCDTATLQREYGLHLATSPVSTCLSIATVLTITASRTSLTQGTSVTFTATLKTGAAASHKKLAKQVLPSRTVRLERRVVGSTTWSTVGTMAAASTAGTYTFTYRPLQTYDYRIAFPTPNNEGLVGSTSGIVRVTVTPCTKAPCPVLLATGD